MMRNSTCKGFYILVAGALLFLVVGCKSENIEHRISQEIVDNANLGSIPDQKFLANLFSLGSGPAIWLNSESMYWSLAAAMRNDGPSRLLIGMNFYHDLFEGGGGQVEMNLVCAAIWVPSNEVIGNPLYSKIQGDLRSLVDGEKYEEIYKINDSIELLGDYERYDYCLHPTSWNKGREQLLFSGCVSKNGVDKCTWVDKSTGMKVSMCETAGNSVYKC